MPPALREMQRILEELAGETVGPGRRPAAGTPARRGAPTAGRELAAIHLDEDAAPSRRLRRARRPRCSRAGWPAASATSTTRCCAWSALARGDIEPDLAVVRANWQMFVSPTDWSLAPFLTLWRWDAPPLRHAIRAALAIAAGYAHRTGAALGLARLLDPADHRGGAARQPLADAGAAQQPRGRHAAGLRGRGGAAVRASRRRWRCWSAMTVAQAIAHGFAVRRYLITSVAATVLGPAAGAHAERRHEPHLRAVRARGRHADRRRAGLGLLLRAALVGAQPDPGAGGAHADARRRATRGWRWASASCARWTAAPSSNGGWRAARPTTASRRWCRPRSARCRSRAPCARRWSRWSTCRPTATSCWPS